jgi:hypothetical protein
LNQTENCRHQAPAVDRWLRDDKHSISSESPRWGRKRLEEVRTLHRMFYGRHRLSAKSERRMHSNDPQTRFNVLADRWRDETAFLSALTKKITHPAYLEIIGLGPTALPMVLKRLETEPGYWFVALRALAGQDPVSAEDRGSFRATRAAWLQWGRSRGLLY